MPDTITWSRFEELQADEATLGQHRALLRALVPGAPVLVKRYTNRKAARDGRRWLATLAKRDDVPVLFAFENVEGGCNLYVGSIPAFTKMRDEACPEAGDPGCPRCTGEQCTTHTAANCDCSPDERHHQQAAHLPEPLTGTHRGACKRGPGDRCTKCGAQLVETEGKGKGNRWTKVVKLHDRRPDLRAAAASHSAPSDEAPKIEPQPQSEYDDEAGEMFGVGLGAKTRHGGYSPQAVESHKEQAKLASYRVARSDEPPRPPEGMMPMCPTVGCRGAVALIAGSKIIGECGTCSAGVDVVTGRALVKGVAGRRG